MHRLTTLGLCLLLPLSSLRAQWFDLDKSHWEPIRKPPFARYAVPLTFAGSPAPVDLRTNPRAREFRTVLRTAAKTGPNFADSFTIVYWGGGSTDCATMAIIDARSGRVYFAPFKLTCEIHFERTSRLLPVDPPECFFPVGTKPVPRYQRWYIWNGQSLVLRDSTLMRPIQGR
jgi:hypothetical protein